MYTLYTKNLYTNEKEKKDMSFGFLCTSLRDLFAWLTALEKRSIFSSSISPPIISKYRMYYCAVVSFSSSFSLKNAYTAVYT